MVPLMSRYHECDRAHADRLAARRAAAAPRVGVERAPEPERRGTRGGQLADEIGERAVVVFCDGDVGDFIESGTRRTVATRDPTRALCPSCTCRDDSLQ